jgi:hypothetical protein
LSDSVAFIAITLAVFNIGVFSYAMYWSFAIRKVLSVRLYRRRALWVGVIGAYFVVFFLYATLIGAVGVTTSSSNALLGISTGAYAYVGAVAFFIWIDSAMKVARRTDPLRRDPLHWSILRWFLGFLIFVGTFFGLLFNPSSVTFIRATPLYGPVGLVLLLGGISLLRSASWSGDQSLRRHLKWFGLFAVVAWMTTILESGTFTSLLAGDQDVPLVFSYLLFAFSSFALYKSSKSLIPYGPMPSSSEPPTVPDVSGQGLGSVWGQESK